MENPAEDICFRLTPVSEIQPLVERSGSVVVGTQELPADLVEETVVNPRLAEFLPTKLMKLLSGESQLLALARLTVPLDPTKEFSEQPGKAILAGTFQGRSLSLAHGIMPYTELIAYHLSQKGGGPSGKHYPFEGNVEILHDSRDPIGFYGRKEAEREIKFTSILLQYGLRVALPLGYIVLKPEELKSHLRTSWSFLPGAAEELERSLDIVKLNKDVPVILLRLGGTIERLNFAQDDLTHEKHGFRRLRAAIARGAGIWLEELTRFPDRFQRYLDQGGIDADQARKVLMKMARQRPLKKGESPRLDTEESQVYLRIIRGIIEVEKEGLRRLLTDHPSYGRFALEDYLGNEKDVCFALLHYDFEMWKPDEEDPRSIPTSQYLIEAMEEK